MARKRVASEPVLRDWAAVDAALRDLKECQYALTELGVELDRRIDGLKDDYTKNAQPLQNRIKRLEGDIKDYVDAHRAELCGKSRVLTFGKVGYRTSSRLIACMRKCCGRLPYWGLRIALYKKRTRCALSISRRGRPSISAGWTTK